MDQPAQDRMPQMPPADSFRRLPLELRNMIYDLLIEESIVDCLYLFPGLPHLQTSTFSRAHKFDLQISTRKIRYSNLRLPSNLMYTCHQIHAEFSTLVCLRTPHLQVTGDFMMGLSSTAAIFDMLQRRPWIAHSIRTVNVLLKLHHVLPFLGGVAVNTSVLEQYPWLGERLKIAELRVRKFDLKGSRMQLVPRAWWQEMRAKSRVLHWCLETFGVHMLKVEQPHDAQEKDEHNTLPDLAKLFESFPLLEKIDIETEHCHFLSLFPVPRDTAESFRELNERGVEVNVLLKQWQKESFCNMLSRNGVERGTIRFGNDRTQGRIAVSYETIPEGLRQKHQIVSFRLIDCVVRQDEAEDGSQAGMQPSRWNMAFWRTKEALAKAAGDDAASMDRNPQD